MINPILSQSQVYKVKKIAYISPIDPGEILIRTNNLNQGTDMRLSPLIDQNCVKDGRYYYKTSYYT